MVELSRRLFLGGSITLLAAVMFEPKSIGNTPQIWGDGRHDDTAGLGALLRGEPVISPKEYIGVESHQGIIIHRGDYLVSQTIIIPEECQFKIEAARLIATGQLDEDNASFFSTHNYSQYLKFVGNRQIIFEHKRSKLTLVS